MAEGVYLQLLCRTLKEIRCQTNKNLPTNGIKTRKGIADIYIDDRSCIALYEK